MAVWRVVVSGALYGSEKWANVFHVDVAGTPDSEAIFDAFQKAYKDGATGNHYLNMCPGTVASGTIGVTLTKFSLQKVVDPGIAIERVTALEGEQNTGNAMPLDACVVVSWVTNRAGKSYRGRTYLPPFHHNQSADGAGQMPHLISAAQTKIQVASGALLADLGAAGAPLVVYSRKLGTGQPIIGGYVDDEWDTQRRRTQEQPRSRVLFGDLL